jgi:hypothetical protein
MSNNLLRELQHARADYQIALAELHTIRRRMNQLEGELDRAIEAGDHAHIWNVRDALVALGDRAARVRLTIDQDDEGSMQ